MESVPPGYEDELMEILTTIAAVITGLFTLVVGAFSVAAIWFDDLP